MSDALLFEVRSSMYSACETSPIANIGVFEATFSVFVRFGHRLFVHMTPTEARALGDAFAGRSREYVRIDLSLSLSGYALVRWNAPTQCSLLIGGVAVALFDHIEAASLAIALKACATQAVDLLEGQPL